MRVVFFFILVFALSCSTQKPILSETNSYIEISHSGDIQLVINLTKGEAFNHPSYVVWLEDVEGNLLQTVFVTRSYATGRYAREHKGGFVWGVDSGTSIRPASMPYWKHKFDAQSTPQSIPDAITGATPKGNATITTHTHAQLSQFRVLVEVNQAWDCNSFWTTNKFPDNLEYRTSCQPSLIYAVTVNLADDVDTYFLNPIGHGHYAGENGNLYTDLRGFTTALNIFETMSVIVKKK